MAAHALKIEAREMIIDAEERNNFSGARARQIVDLATEGHPEATVSAIVVSLGVGEHGTATIDVHACKKKIVALLIPKEEFNWEALGASAVASPPNDDPTIVKREQTKPIVSRINDITLVSDRYETPSRWCKRCHRSRLIAHICPVKCSHLLCQACMDILDPTHANDPIRHCIFCAKS